mmetsp:Transcript_19584/g.17330  ORF Transcript_19584/g.17330 Transcript_19584/m.17330 type:complete len:259 (-) Transcript_19584:54-830(-)
MDQTDEMDNSVDLQLDEFRNTFKSNFGKSDITSEFDFTVDGRFKSNNLQHKRSMGGNGADTLSPFNIQDDPKDQFPSMVQFNDYADANDFRQQRQTSKPFGNKKRTSQQLGFQAKESAFDPLRKSVGRESLNAQGSTIKRKNSQNESDIFNEFKSEIMTNTNQNKFSTNGRKSEGGDIDEQEHSRNLSLDDQPNSLEADIDGDMRSENSQDDYDNDLNDLLGSDSDDEFDVQPISSTNINQSTYLKQINNESNKNLIF